MTRFNSLAAFFALFCGALWMLTDAFLLKQNRAPVVIAKNYMATLSATPLRKNETADPARTQLRGPRLWFARGMWLFVCIASFGMTAALVPLILRMRDYGDWMIERTAQLFGLNIFSNAFDAYALALLGVKYFGVVVFYGVALYIFWRKADDWMAILVSILLLTMPHTFNLVGYTKDWYRYPHPWDELLYALDTLYNSIGFALLFAVFLLFPDGRFVPRWTRWFAITAILLVVTIWLGQVSTPHDFWDNTSLWLILVSVFFGLLLLAAASQIYRYRIVSTPAQQAQTRFVVLSLVTLVAFWIALLLPVIGLTAFMDSPFGALLSLILNGLAPVLLPLSFGVAMLRDQLWQSERVLNRAFLYFALTAILLVVYVLIIAALSEIFRATNNFVIAAIATGVIALLFQPLRARLQRGINRFLYGQRDEPFTVLNQLGNELENSIAPETALPLIVETIGKNLRVPYAAIEIQTISDKQATEFGTRTNNLTTLLLRYQNETVGELVVAQRAPNEKFSPADMQLLENLARQAGAVAYTARLHAQLRQSREKIIQERENERKRLRRDLHDGLGPTLASQTLKLDAAIDLLDSRTPETVQARNLLTELKTQTQNTVADIRRIVYELRPPALDDLGPVGALRAHLAQYAGAGGPQITFDAPDELPPLSAAVQVNAYRIVAEAVNNVVTHARAKHCAVHIVATDALYLEIADDGIGLTENFRAGVGIASMRERAEELGGTFRIRANAPQGTHVFAKLPLSSENQKTRIENPT